MRHGAIKIETSTFGASVMKLGYGISVKDSDDSYITVAEEALEGAAAAGIPGAFLVDLFPFMRHIPSWFPGAGFQKKAARWKEANTTMTEKPFRYVQEQMVQVHFMRVHELL
jgi:hypothetical protein